MAINRRRLAILADRANFLDPAEPTTPSEVLYAGPIPDGSRKLCMNCSLWLSGEQQCFIFDESVVVPPSAICGYHAFGHSKLTSENRAPDMDPVDPELAGFDQVPGGTSCDRCFHYQSMGREDGLCGVNVDPTTRAKATVAALGCCTRWRSARGA